MKFYRSYVNISSKPSKHQSSFLSLKISFTKDLKQILCRYGWFWECPNGENCQYRHALPPGFVLKSQRKAEEDAAKANIISIEAFIEVEVRFSFPLFG
jgi:hypothetical protein